jgi:hypothetical protein
MASDFALGVVVGAVAILFPRIPEFFARAVRSCVRSVAYRSLDLLDKLDADLRESDFSAQHHPPPHIPVASWRQEELDFEENVEQSRAEVESDGDSAESEPIEEHGAPHDNSPATE